MKKLVKSKILSHIIIPGEITKKILSILITASFLIFTGPVFAAEPAAEPAPSWKKPGLSNAKKKITKKKITKKKIANKNISGSGDNGAVVTGSGQTN